MKLLCCCIIALFQCLSAIGQMSQSVTAFADRGLYFAENKGQVTDQNGCVRDDIDFQLKAAPGLNVFVGAGKINYQFSRPVGSCDMPETDLRPSVQEYEMYRLDVTLKGANPFAEKIVEDVLPYYQQYHTSVLKGIVHAYSKVTYRNIYRNIDWVLYDKNGRLEYDFIVRPGGDVKDIQIQYDGANELLTGNGYVTAVTPMGTITEKALHCYVADSRQKVMSEFVCNDRTISFDVGRHSGTLVIDPSVEWATYFGGENNDGLCRITSDNAGHIYMSGSARSLSAIATTGAHQTVHGGGTDDVFLSKYTTGGVLLWSTYYGGSGSDATHSDVVVDSTGDIYISGWTGSPGSIATPGAHQSVYGGGEDAFLAKFSNSGSLLWATYFGGAGSESGNDIACDRMGNVYIAGATGSVSGIATPGAHDNTLSGAFDAFFARFTTDGVLVWATYFGGEDVDGANTIECDGAGQIYIGGNSKSTDAIATPGAHNTVLGAPGFSDSFLAKFRNNGAIVWSTYYGGSHNESAVYGIGCDSSLNVYITGQTSSTDSIATPGAHQVTLNGFGDTYLAKFGGDGNLLWGTYYGGSGSEFALDLTCKRPGTVCVVGGTTSMDNIATPTAVKTYRSGGISPNDAFLSIFSTSGVLQWATYFGSTGSEDGQSVTIDEYENYYMCGQERSLDSIATPGAHQTVFGGGATDCFLVKYNMDTIAAPIDTTDTVTVFVSDHSFHNEPSVFPNPVLDIMHISFGELQISTVAVVVTDITGRVVSVSNPSIAKGLASVDLSALKAGFYFFKLYNNGALIKSGKVVVLK